MSAFSLPMPYWYAFMAGQYKAQVERSIERARSASDPELRCFIAKGARNANHQMIWFLRRARGAA